MKTREIKWTLLPAVLALSLSACGQEADSLSVPSGPAMADIAVTVFQTGKSDCILLELDGANVLIDTAEKGDGGEIVEELQSRGIDRLDLLLLTHLDKDHIGGAAEVLEQLAVDRLIQADYEEDSKQYRAYEEAQLARGVEAIRLTEPLELSLGGAVFRLLPGENPPYEEDNDYSILTEMAYGDTRFLFAGDAEERRLTEYLADDAAPCDFLKVPHHGRYNDVTAVFLSQMQPQIAVITCSDKNPAEPETLEVLERLGARVFLTADGTVTVHSDGRTVTVEE